MGQPGYQVLQCGAVYVHNAVGNRGEILLVYQQISPSGSLLDLLMIQCYEWKQGLELEALIVVHQQKLLSALLRNPHACTAIMVVKPAHSVWKQPWKHLWVEAGVVVQTLRLLSMSYAQDLTAVYKVVNSTCSDFVGGFLSQPL